MSLDLWLGAAVALIILIYLLAVLARPERFASPCAGFTASWRQIRATLRCCSKIQVSAIACNWMTANNLASKLASCKKISVVVPTTQ